jgi:hypothetical protein
MRGCRFIVQCPPIDGNPEKSSSPKGFDGWVLFFQVATDSFLSVVHAKYNLGLWTLFPGFPTATTMVV